MQKRINKEIGDYTESVYFGLSVRQLIFSALAVGVAVALYFLLRGSFGTETVSWMCVLGAAPFAVMGFFKYNGMTAEAFLRAFFISKALGLKKLRFVSESAYFWPSKATCGKGRRFGINAENSKKDKAAGV